MEQKHPSHGLISAHRISGGEYHLFGSRLTHNETIEIRVHTGESDRSLRDDRYLEGRELVSVRLTEVQWAAFISSLNIGRGVPCTLERVGTERFEPCPPPEDSVRQHTDENRAMLQEALKDLRGLSAQLGEETAPNKAPSKKTLSQIKRQLDILLGNLPANLEYSHKMFEEHVEKIVVEAQASVEAHVMNVVTTLGIKAAAATLPAGLSGPKKISPSEPEARVEAACEEVTAPCALSCQSACQITCQAASQHRMSRK